MDCLIQLNDDTESQALLGQLPADACECFRSKRADAAGVLLELLIYLSPLTIPIVASVIKERIKAKKFVRVKVKGLEIHGLSEESVERILREHLDARK